VTEAGYHLWSLPLADLLLTKLMLSLVAIPVPVAESAG
jgi:hypothetical protein